MTYRCAKWHANVSVVTKVIVSCVRLSVIPTGAAYTYSVNRRLRDWNVLKDLVIHIFAKNIVTMTQDRRLEAWTRRRHEFINYFIPRRGADAIRWSVATHSGPKIWSKIFQDFLKFNFRIFRSYISNSIIRYKCILYHIIK